MELLHSPGGGVIKVRPAGAAARIKYQSFPPFLLPPLAPHLSCDAATIPTLWTFPLQVQGFCTGEQRLSLRSDQEDLSGASGDALTGCT